MRSVATAMGLDLGTVEIVATSHFDARGTLIPIYDPQTTAANTVSAIGSLDELHPGALRYFREAGVVR